MPDTNKPEKPFHAGTNNLKPGYNPNGGRRKGSKNAATKLLKEAVLIAADGVGEDGQGADGLIGYCKFLAKKHPAVFTTLLNKIIPMQVAVQDEENVIHRIEIVAPDMETPEGEGGERPAPDMIEINPA